jgi:protein MAK11
LLQIALPSPDSRSAEKSTTILASASSDGRIHVYDLASLPQPPILANLSTSQTLPKSTLDPIAVYDTKGTRLTCLTLAASEPAERSTSKIAGVKRRRVDEIEEGEEGEEEDEDENAIEREELDDNADD